MITCMYYCLGDPTAHVALAHCYSNGKGVDQSHQEAFKYNMTAAEMGTHCSHYHIAIVCSIIRLCYGPV